MSEEVKKTPIVSQQARNIIVGLITTILVSGTIYLLGFNKKSGPSRLAREKATTEAWKSYVTIENIYAKNTTLLLRDAGTGQYKSYAEMFSELKKESDQFMVSIKKLVVADNVDNDMVSVLKRRMDNEETSIPRAENFFVQLDGVVKTAIDETWSMQQVTDTITARQAAYNEEVKGFMDRALSEIESLSKVLTDRYRQPFNIDDFYIVQVYRHKKDILSILAQEKNEVPVTEEYITGKWDNSGATIIMYADKKWSWFVPADSSMVEGDWELKDEVLTLNVPKNPKTNLPGKWLFDISDVKENSFSIQLRPKEKQTALFYTLIRKK